MNISVPLRAATAFAIAALAVTAAQAAPTVYFGNNPGANGGVVDGTDPGTDPVNQRDLFKSKLDSTKIQTETFETRGFLSSSDIEVKVSDIFGSASGVTLTASSPNSAGSPRTRIQLNTWGGTPGAPGTDGFLGRFSTTGDPSSDATLNSGSNYTGGKWFETNFQTVTVDFTNKVSAFGTFLTDLADFDGQLAVGIFSGTDRLIQKNLVSPSGGQNQGGLGFFGYIDDSTSFDRVVFTITQTGTNPGAYDIVGFDDFMTGPLKNGDGGGGDIPEPTSLALVGLSLSLLGLWRRRKTSV